MEIALEKNIIDVILSISDFHLAELNYLETYVDLMVIHLSCSSFLVSVMRVSPALADAMIPAFATRESVKVDLPWST